MLSVYRKPAAGQINQEEVHLYGNSRLGIVNRHLAADSSFILVNSFGKIYSYKFTRGEKLFELSNHLGNVLVTLADRVQQVKVTGDTVRHYLADVRSANDYYPFGMLMPGKKFNAGSFRYGFNGKENDNEVKGTGNQVDYGMRIHDSRIGRFLSVDPLAKSYPWNSTYAYAEGDVIRSIDLDGLEKYIIHQRSFAPWDFFGEIATGGKYKYSGDNRGFTVASDNNVKSKVSTSITVAIASAKATLTESKQAGNTVRYESESEKVLKIAPQVTPEVSLWKPLKEGNKLTIKARIEGKAPIAPFPILDPVSSLVDQPIVWTGTTKIENNISKGYIDVNYHYIGKGFPAFEAFIEDQNGTKIFMGINISPGKSNILQALSGSEFAYGKAFNLKIATDADGNFLGVYGKDSNGNQIIRNPTSHNKIFEGVSAAMDLK